MPNKLIIDNRTGLSDLNEKNEMTKEEFAANEIREFCAIRHNQNNINLIKHTDLCRQIK